MIRKVSRKDLDLDKYSACLNKAINYRIYAEYWYLDALIGSHWDCYILNDYEAVMPLPYTKKLGLKLITQPTYCQQLGVFYQVEITEEIFQEFEKKLHRNLVRSYSFNEENTKKFSPKGEKKVNQILELNFDYDTYLQQLRKNRKQEINKGLPNSYRLTENNFDKNFIQLIEENYTEIENQLQLTTLKKLVQEIQKRKLGKTVNLHDSNNVVASSFYLKSNNRLIQLCNAKVKNNTINYNTFIVNHLIKKNLNQQFILDFEGSSLKGIQEFNTSFRAELKYFTVYKNFL